MFGNERKRKASLKAMFALLFYLAIPLTAIYIILHNYPELGTERFESMVYWFVPLSILLVIVSQLSIRYDKGDVRRYLLNIAYVLITISWLIAFLGGGLNITQTWGEYEFTLHLWKYIALILAVAVFNIVYYTAEWRVHLGERYVEEGNSSIGLIPFLNED